MCPARLSSTFFGSTGPKLHSNLNVHVDYGTPLSVCLDNGTWLAQAGAGFHPITSIGPHKIYSAVLSSVKPALKVARLVGPGNRRTGFVHNASATAVNGEAVRGKKKNPRQRGCVREVFIWTQYSRVDFMRTDRSDWMEPRACLCQPRAIV
jgi:hypothetical protein